MNLGLERSKQQWAARLKIKKTKTEWQNSSKALRVWGSAQILILAKSNQDSIAQKKSNPYVEVNYIT